MDRENLHAVLFVLRWGLTRMKRELSVEFL
jgi:hypothetical protein